MDKVSSLLGVVLKRRGLAQHAEAAYVVHTVRGWLSVHAPHLADHIVVASLKDGILTLKCDQPSVLTECHMLLIHLTEYVKKEHSTQKISEIRCIRT